MMFYFLLFIGAVFLMLSGINKLKNLNLYNSGKVGEIEETRFNYKLFAFLGCLFIIIAVIFNHLIV